MTRKITAAVRGRDDNESIIRHQNQARAPTQSEACLPANSQPPAQTLFNGFPHSPTLPYPAHVLSSLTLTTTKSKKPHTHIIPPKTGHAFLLKSGQSFRIIDLHGAQVVDLMAWTHPIGPFGQHSSMSYTRYNIGGSAPPQVGECLFTNLGGQMLKLTADTVKTHDLLYMACNPSFYANMGLPGHANCAENISAAVTAAALGEMGWNDVVDPFNVFQNTPYYTLKALGCSKAGDFVEFENVAGADLVVGLSCCPYEGKGFNGGRVTEVAVVTDVD